MNLRQMIVDRRAELQRELAELDATEAVLARLVGKAPPAPSSPRKKPGRKPGRKPREAEAAEPAAAPKADRIAAIKAAVEKPTTGSKRCSKCTTEKPVTEFYKGPVNGLSSWCKDCTKAANNARKNGQPKPAGGKPFAHKGHSQRMRAAAGDPTDELICNTCDAQVTRAKAGQHMYEAHKQNVAVQRIDEFFEAVA